MIKKILFAYQNKLQLSIAAIGVLFGLTFLVLSIHYLIRINEFGKGEEILGSNTLIVQKKISSLSTLNLVKSDFSEKEITDFKSQQFIEKLQPVLNNSFGITLQTDSKFLPYFRSDVFVQSIDDEFIKVDDGKWEWSKEDEYVPMVLPRDFLVMINTFAGAKGIPRVSEDLVKSVGFKFTLYDDNKEESYKAKIAGFTNEIASILVPEEFILYGNQNFQANTPAMTTQLLLTIKKGAFGDFEKFAVKHFLEIKENSMLIGKLKSLAGTMFTALIGISIFIVFLSSLILFQYVQLLISKNRYEIRTLLRLGYSPNKINYSITRYFLISFGVLSGISFIVFVFIKTFIDEKLIKNGIDVLSGFTVSSVLALLFVLLIFACSSYLNVKRGILKIK